MGGGGADAGAKETAPQFFLSDVESLSVKYQI